MELYDFLKHLNSGAPVYSDSEAFEYMHELSNEAMRITFRLNGSYHTPEEIRALFSQLTGKPVDESFRMFPPFYTDCGKNTTIGKNVFINSCCHFQDQGGIVIVTLATLNHGMAPQQRQSLYPAPIVIGRNVWIGAGVTVVPGITIGNNAVVGAGSVVTKNVPANTVVAGIPAKRIKTIEPNL